MMTAVTYFIAGRSNCPLFAKAQRIGEIISRNLPSVAVRIQSQHPSEWNHYLNGICDRLHFKHSASPIVYTHLGTLIGDSDAFLSLVKKTYGDIAEFPTTILNDLANENFISSSQELQKKELAEKSRLNEEQWELRNERYQKIQGQVIEIINSRMDAVGNLIHSCQGIKATLTVAPEKNKLPAESRYLANHLATISNTLPSVDAIQKDIDQLSTKSDTLGSIPSLTTAGQFSSSPDTIWQHMITDHRTLMTDFLSSLSQLHHSNDILQEEANKLAQSFPLPSSSTSPRPPSSSSRPPSSTSSSSSPSPIPIDRFQKSVSFAGLDSQFSPKDKEVAFNSLPTTPKKESSEVQPESKEKQVSKEEEEREKAVGPIKDAIKAMLAIVDEGLIILKNAKKQLRVDSHNAHKHAAALKQVLNPDEYRHFRLRERKEIGKNVHLFRFDLPLSSDTLGCAIGKHIFVKIGNVERAYTPITTDFDQGHFDLAIKITRDTPMMDFFTNMSVGDWVPIKGPLGVNIIKENEPISGIAMFAHGVGLTPMLQIVRHYLSQDDNKLPLWLLYFNTDDKTFLKEELERLSANHTRFNLRYIPSKPGNHWEHLEINTLAPSLPFRPSGFDFSSEPHPIKIFICGTKNFTKKTKTLLEEIGHKSEFIHTF